MDRLRLGCQKLSKIVELFDQDSFDWKFNVLTQAVLYQSETSLAVKSLLQTLFFKALYLKNSISQHPENG